MFLTFLEAAGQNTTQTPPVENLIGIGGIIATVVIGILTCLVTWKLTMKSIKQRNLSYNIHVYPILSNSIAKKDNKRFEDLNITFKGKALQNPCLLTVEIINTGNEAIEKPPILISNDEGIEIVPGYFEDVPDGYGELWELELKNPFSCEIKLDHINPKQIVKTRFFLDDFPKNEIKFTCPIPNVQLQKLAYNDRHNNTSKVGSHSKANTVLIAITVLLFLSIDSWGYYLTALAWPTVNQLTMARTVLFVMSVPLLTIMINTFGLTKIDLYLSTNRNVKLWIMTGLLFVSSILLVMITYNYIIDTVFSQTIAAVIVVVLLSLSIHVALIAENK